MQNKKKILNKYNFIILDLDGVIFDSKENMKIAWESCRKKFRLKPTFYDYFNHLGLPFNTILKNLKIQKNNEKIKNYYQQVSKEKLGKINIYISVKKTLNKLKKKRIKFSIVTSKNKKRSLILLKKYNITMMSVHCASKNKPGKPSPYLLNEAIRKNKMNKKKTCFIGDTYIDYLAAKRAKVDFIYAKYGYGNNKFQYKKNISVFSDIQKYI